MSLPSKKWVLLAGMVLTMTILLTLFFILLEFYQPTPKSELTVLHQWVWHYLLVEPIAVLPNTVDFDIRSRRHLLDIKNLLEMLWQVFLISITISAIIISIGLKTYFTLLLRYSAYIGMILLCLGAVAVIIDFRAMFIGLHHLFFVANSWVFPQDSLLIQLFPLSYFKNFFFLWFSLCLGVFLCLFMFSCKLMTLQEKSRNANSNTIRH